MSAARSSSPPNLPFENWTQVLGSERLTGALRAKAFRRLTHHVSILAMTGDSYRLEHPPVIRQAAVREEKNQATTETVDPDTGQLTTT